MKVAQVAPLAESVPSSLYGGTERVIYWLTEELVRQGHEVTLLGTADSQTSAKLIPVWPRALRLGRPRSDPIVAAASALEVLSHHASEFDIIHSHGDWCYLPVLARLGVPFVTTLHGRLDIFRLPQLISMFPQAPFVSISNDQRSPLPNANWAATVETFAAAARHAGTQIDIMRRRASSAPGIGWPWSKSSTISFPTPSNMARTDPSRICAEDRGDKVCIRVRDHRPGIPVDARTRIFGRFERAVGPDERRSGFGVGLWVVGQLVNAMGGTIRVDDAEGGGSVFTVILPRHGDAVRP